MTGLIEWLTGDDTRSKGAEDDASIDILAEGRDTLPPHVLQFLELKASATE